MSYTVFDDLGRIGVVDYMIVHRGVCSWFEDLGSKLQPAVSHLQELIVDEEWGCRGCGGRGSIGGAIFDNGRGGVDNGVAREDGCAAGCQC